MKPTFHASAVNNLFEDPCVYARILREKKALLFDVGDISRLSAGSLLKITDIFVTHTHIDHFIGFDTLLRNILRRDIPVRLFGPAPLIACVEGKLRGYTWNLINDYPLRIEVFEVSEGGLSHASFHAEDSFRRLDNPASAFRGTLAVDPLFTVKGVLLSHDIPVMAYSLEEEYHININKALLREMDLPVGPWLSNLKKAVRQRHKAERQNPEGARRTVPGEDTGLPVPFTEFEVKGRVYALEDLLKIVTITRGQKISYVMDVSPTEENLEKIIPFVSGSDLLFCEAYFLERDRNRAETRNHLTAALAGRIAREGRIGSLAVMHVSPKYRDALHLVFEEAAGEFKGAVLPVTSGITSVRDNPPGSVQTGFFAQ